MPYIKKLGTPRERLYKKIKQNGNNECWEWIASQNQYGYGRVWINNKIFLSHRLSYELHKGKIPKGLCVLHSCDNPPCCNPKHLFLGTHTDNMRDMERKGRSKHLKGDKHGSARLTLKEVIKIREIHASKKITIKEIGDDFSVSDGHVSRIINNKAWII